MKLKKYCFFVSDRPYPLIWFSIYLSLYCECAILYSQFTLFLMEHTIKSAEHYPTNPGSSNRTRSCGILPLNSFDFKSKTI
jgi:hypothetical protein